jgi:phage FluMu protein Com
MMADHAPPLVLSPVIDQRPRCWRCEKVLAEFVARPWRFICPRCKAVCNPPKDDHAA